jgi:hypothetical protein
LRLRAASNLLRLLARRARGLSTFDRRRRMLLGMGRLVTCLVAPNLLRRLRTPSLATRLLRLRTWRRLLRWLALRLLRRSLRMWLSLGGRMLRRTLRRLMALRLSRLGLRLSRLRLSGLRLGGLRRGVLLVLLLVRWRISPGNHRGSAQGDRGDAEACDQLLRELGSHDTLLTASAVQRSGLCLLKVCANSKLRQ